jgi:hypothetical protein
MAGGGWNQAALLNRLLHHTEIIASAERSYRLQEGTAEQNQRRASQSKRGKNADSPRELIREPRFPEPLLQGEQQEHAAAASQQKNTRPVLAKTSRPSIENKRPGMVHFEVAADNKGWCLRITKRDLS